MKLFKKISALVMTVAIFGSTAFAGDLKFDDKLEYAADATKVTVNVYSKIDNVGAYAETLVTYDPEVYTFNKAESSSPAESYELADNGDAISWSTLAVYNIVDTSEPYITLVFDVNDGKNPVGTTFSISDVSWMYNAAEDYDYDVADISITVTAATPAEPVPGTVGEKDGKTTVVDDNKATRFVVSATATNISATSASVLNATYDGETQSANLYKLLGVENEGNITIGSLTVKAVLPATVENASDVGAFSITVE